MAAPFELVKESGNPIADVMPLIDVAVGFRNPELSVVKGAGSRVPEPTNWKPILANKASQSEAVRSLDEENVVGAAKTNHAGSLSISTHFAKHQMVASSAIQTME
jgi:hypothetical protein